MEFFNVVFPAAGAPHTNSFTTWTGIVPVFIKFVYFDRFRHYKKYEMKP